VATSPSDPGGSASSIKVRIDPWMRKRSPFSKIILRHLIAELKVNGRDQDPAHLPRRHAGGLRNVRKVGAMLGSNQ